MHRNNFSLADLADLNTLADAFWRAARKKQDRVEVQRFARHLDEQLDRLARQIRNETLTLGHFNHFRIHDPKPREISAPGFRERVLHHALIHHLGPILDRAAVYDSYACRKGKGPVRAVLRAQQHLRRFSWYVQIDIRRYFDSIDHEILKGLVRRKLKDRGVLALCDRIIDSYHTTPGCGLPIGALTSQYFANLYLDGLPSNMSCRRHLFQHKHRARNLTRSLRDDTVVLLAEPTPITGGQELNRFLLEACIDRRPQPFAGLPAFVAQAQCQFRGNSLTKRGNTHMGANRVYRGGSWNDNARNVRAANRNNWHPGDGNSNLGFRCARAHPRTGRFVPDPAVILSAIAAANSNKPPVCE